MKALSLPSSSLTLPTIVQSVTSISSTSMVVKYNDNHTSTNNTRKAIMKMRKSDAASSRVTPATPSRTCFTTTAAAAARTGEFVAITRSDAKKQLKIGSSRRINSVLANDDIPFDEREPTATLASLNNSVGETKNNRKINKIGNDRYDDLGSTSIREGLSVIDGKREEEQVYDDVDDDVLLSRYLEDVCRRRCVNKKDIYSSKFHGDAEYITPQPKYQRSHPYQLLNRRTVVADESCARFSSYRNQETTTRIDDSRNVKNDDDIYPPEEIVVTTTTTLPMSIPTLDEIPIQIVIPVELDTASDISDEFCFFADGFDIMSDEYCEDKSREQERDDEDSDQGGGHHCNRANHNNSSNHDDLDCLYNGSTSKYLDEGDDDDWPSDEEDCISNVFGDHLLDAFDGLKALVKDGSASTEEDHDNGIAAEFPNEKRE